MNSRALKAIDRAIADLQQQIDGLEEARAQLTGKKRVARQSKKTQSKDVSAKTKAKAAGGRRKFTEAQKKEASERMKKAWAERRARGEVPPKKEKPKKKKKAAKKVVKKKSLLRGRAKKNIGGAGEKVSARMYDAWKQHEKAKKASEQPAAKK